MSDPSDADLLLKKRARRRLVGAVAFAGLAAVVLPMVMDDEPKQQVQDVQIRIPGQDQAPFNPKLAKPAPLPAAEKNESAVVAKPAEKAVEKTAEKAAEKAPVEKVAEKPAEKAPEKKPEKPADKVVEKAPEKAAEKAKTAEKPTADDTRAAAILSGKHVESTPAASASSNGQFVILIGAFSNPANVKQLQTKLGELGIKVFTESLDSPEGKKTRVRAGPFPSRDAADKAQEKMKRIGVNGVVAAKS